MSDELDPQLLDQLVTELGRDRGYASFYQYSDRQVMERGIVHEALRFLRGEFPGELRSVSSVDPDPPDCLIETTEARIGVEVTELVDRTYLEMVVRAKRAGFTIYDWAPWDKEKFLGVLEDRIAAKSHPARVNGGPYDEYILLVHTAEPDLDPGTVRGWLETASTVDRGIITGGYLLFDYRPKEDALVVHLPRAGEA